MQPVKISIVSIAKDGDGEETITKQQYKGVLAEKNGKYYAIYDEDSQSGLDNTKTTLKWDDKRVIIVRSGSVHHRQEFCCGYKDQSIYITPYLKIPLLTETTYLYTCLHKGIWHLEMEYILYHGESPYGEMKILIDIEEDTQIGH